MPGIGISLTQMDMEINNELTRLKGEDIMEIYIAVQQLLNQAKRLKMLDSTDEIYARNQLLSLLHLDGFFKQPVDNELPIPDLLDIIADYAVKAGIIKDLMADKDILKARIMNVFMPKPSELNDLFDQRYKVHPEQATAYFYNLSRNSNYIQTKQIAKNITYTVETDYGELDITINLSKPEKDPKQIALEREMKPVTTNYPTCLLCIENEGYAGRVNHPARSNHRMVRIPLCNETWYLQYSPYLYYNEHCILLSGEHRDMKINFQTFTNLLTFVKKFPHYFIGSNADIPIVGGSILTHDHYQGGRYEFAMARAKEEDAFSIKGFPSISAHIVKWPMSVIRIKGVRLEEVAGAADRILQKWINYSDPAADILAYTGDTRHNTITPIARMRDGLFELDLVLRNNRTSEDHPLGIFHPHQDVHHIKKENIGLIEVMGLAVLPARLQKELIEVEKYLLNHPNEIKDYHRTWAELLKLAHDKELSPETAKTIVSQAVGSKFLKCLEDAGVFKRNLQGKQAFQRFIDML